MENWDLENINIYGKPLNHDVRKLKEGYSWIMTKILSITLTFEIGLATILFHDRIYQNQYRS